MSQHLEIQRKLWSWAVAGLLAASVGACAGKSTTGSTGNPGDTGPVTPPSTLDSTAIITAGVLAGGGDSFNTMMALSMAGFDQMAADGTVFMPGQTPTQGIAFEHDDAATIAEGLGDGVRISIDDLLGFWAAVALSHATSDADWTAKVAAMRAALVTDLTVASVSKSDTYRFWAQLIVQLGRVSPEEYDLLDPAVPGTSLLDPMQVALLSYRFQADLWAAGRKAAGMSLQPRPTLPGAAATPRPCTMTETQATIMDGAALGTTQLMEKLVEEVGKTIGAAEKYGKFMGAANSALTIVKILWTFLAFDAHITADTDMLTRNWDGTTGGPARLTATFQFTTGNAQVMNCIRPALTALGLDFSLPQDGPITNAGLDWEMYKNWERTKKTPLIQYKSGSGSPLNHHTDTAGQDSVDVEGAAKSPALTGTIVPDYRMVSFAAKIALKDCSFGQTLLDSIGAVTAANPAMVAISLAAEGLFRAKTLVFAGHYRLPVEDHQSLDNVVITTELSGAVTGTLTAGGRGSESADASVYLIEKPAPTAQPVTFALINNFPSAGAFQLKENGVRTVGYHASGTFVAPCMCATGDETTAVQADLSGINISDGDDFTLPIQLQPDGTYSMDLPLGSVTYRGATHSQISGCGNPGDPPVLEDTPVVGPYSLGKVTVTGQLDLTKTSGTIQGVLNPDIVVSVPYTMGGYYQSGVAQTQLHLTGTVKYIVGYTLNKVTIPGARPSAQSERALAMIQEARALESAAVPATTSWLAERREERLRACMR
jgi:hypothetical protein